MDPEEKLKRIQSLLEQTPSKFKIGIYPATTGKRPLNDKLANSSLTPIQQPQTKGSVLVTDYSTEEIGYDPQQPSSMRKVNQLGVKNAAQRASAAALKGSKSLTGSLVSE